MVQWVRIWATDQKFVRSYPSTTNLPHLALEQGSYQMNKWSRTVSDGWKLSTPHNRTNYEIGRCWWGITSTKGSGNTATTMATGNHKIQVHNEVTSNRTLAGMWVNLYLPQLFCVKQVELLAGQPGSIAVWLAAGSGVCQFSTPPAEECSPCCINIHAFT